MSTIGNRIRTNSQEHPHSDDLQRLSRIPAANLDDAVNRLFAMDPGIRALNTHSLCGPALTVRVPDGDNLFIHVAMDMINPGEVLVVKGGAGADRALLGELMLRYLATKNIGGVIVDGLIRDLDYIQHECPFPVYARGACPNGPYKNGPGEINFPIACGGVVVSPGDVVLADADGAVVIPREDFGEALTAVEGVQAKEADIIAGIERTETFDRPWVEEQIHKLGTVTVDD